MTWVAVAALGALGAALRAYAADRLSPLAGTAMINIGAAFLLGLTSNWSGLGGTAVQVGLLGALSTWSTLAHHVIDLARAGDHRRAAAYLGTTLVCGVGAAWIGLSLS